MKLFCTTKNEKETAAFAKKFARTLKGGETILLIGDLGAGKTTFTRALARALGIKAKIKSPTFTLMNIMKTLKHKSIKVLVHCDAYRITHAKDLAEIGLMDFVGRPDTVVIIEWGEKIKSLLRKAKPLSLRFLHGKAVNERRIAGT